MPLKADYSHDVKAMLAANPNAGIYYVCSPNNPTGTITPMADIEWLVDNKPAGSIVVIDEAYIHWTAGYPSNTATHLAAAGKDVLIMRTFSKIFGMAGMRVGYCMGRPDLVKKLRLHDDGALSGQLPIPVHGLRHRQPDREEFDRPAPRRADHQPHHDRGVPRQSAVSG